MDSFQVRLKDSKEAKAGEWKAFVFFRDGYFIFQVEDKAENIVAAGGADLEFPTLGDLIQGSKQWIAWERERSMMNRLEKLRRQNFDAETQRLLSRVLV